MGGRSHVAHLNFKTSRVSVYKCLSLIGCGHTWAFFYYSKVEFTTVNTFSNVTGFSHFTMVNTDLVCCGGNGGRMKAKFTIVNFPKTIWFIAGISKLCLFS